MKAAIIAHGQVDSIDIVKNECASADYVLCADGGAEYAYRADVVPNYLIGDFDSIDEEILKHFSAKDSKIIRYPKEKDFTDAELCIIKAIEIGCNEICLLGMTGKRIDHTLGNIGLLNMIKKYGADGYIACDDCVIYLCSDKIKLKGKIGDTVSIIPFKGDGVGVSTKSLKYPLNNAVLEFGRPLGISNVMLEETCEISIESGELLVIKELEYKDK